MTFNRLPTEARIDAPMDVTGLLRRARAEERARLAEELHDELGALLMAAKLDVAGLKARCEPLSADLADRFQHLAQLLNEGVALKTRIVEGLQPSGLARLGLLAALDNLARDFACSTDIAVTTHLRDCELDAHAQLGAYRLVQECLTNIGKHARASEVTIDLLDSPAGAMVVVADNGVGFDRCSVSAHSHGLAGMQHRVQDLGGRVTVTSRPGAGTRVVALLPATRLVRTGEGKARGIRTNNLVPTSQPLKTRASLNPNDGA